MSIAVSAASGVTRQDYTGVLRRSNVLTITGLSEGANTVPHGLPYTPRSINLRPGAAGLWGETSAPDATNIYITVGTGGATAGKVDAGE